MVELRRGFEQGALSAERFESLALELAAAADEAAVDQREPLLESSPRRGQLRNDLSHAQKQLLTARDDLEICLVEEATHAKGAANASIVGTQTEELDDALYETVLLLHAGESIDSVLTRRCRAGLSPLWRRLGGRKSVRQLD